MKESHPVTVLQICNHYNPPFLDVNRQYAALFAGQNVQVVTVFLQGAPADFVRQAGIGDEVIFLNLGDSQIQKMREPTVGKLRELAARYRFRFCIAHRYHATKLALKAGIKPVLSVHHGFGTYQRFGRRWFVNRHRDDLTLLNVSDAVRDETRAVLPRWPADKIRTFYNRIDLARARAALLSKQEARRRLGLPDDAYVIANVGRLHRDKDQKTLLEGFATALPFLPDQALLAIYGKGPLESALREQANHLDISDRVRFGGFVEGIASHFSAFDVFALTSDHEPFGMVLLEAMAADVPVISSDCGGAPEVTGNTGLLFALGNPGALADCMATLAAQSRQELAAMQRAQRDRVEHRFSDHAARRFFDLEFQPIRPGTVPW